MRPATLPLWLLIAVAAAIAAVAFALAQVRPGSGMIFVIAVTTLWTAYVAHRTRRMTL